MDIVDEVKAIFDEKNNLIKQLRGVIDSLLAANKDLQAWYDSSREDAARLREALKPFANRAALYDLPKVEYDFDVDWLDSGPRIRIGDLRAARTALKESE